MKTELLYHQIVYSLFMDKKDKFRLKLSPLMIF